MAEAASHLYCWYAKLCTSEYHWVETCCRGLLPGQSFSFSRTTWKSLVPQSVLSVWTFSSFHHSVFYIRGFPGGPSGKESTCQLGRCDSILWIVGTILWRREWQPTPAFLPGKSRGQRSLAGCTPWGHKRVRHSLVTKQKHQKFHIRETNFRSVQCEEQPCSYLKTHFLVFSFSHQIDVIFFHYSSHGVVSRWSR